jgi:hypothetical protein
MKKAARSVPLVFPRPDILERFDPGAKSKVPDRLSSMILSPLNGNVKMSPHEPGDQSREKWEATLPPLMGFLYINDRRGGACLRQAGSLAGGARLVLATNEWEHSIDLSFGTG